MRRSFRKLIILVFLFFTYSGNSYSSEISLDFPNDGDETETTTIFNWEYKVESNDDSITYNFFIAENESFSKVVYQEKDLPISMIYMTNNSELEDNSLGLTDCCKEINIPFCKNDKFYHWKVEVVENFEIKATSEIRDFKTCNTNAPFGIASVSVFNALDYSPVSHAIIIPDENDQPKKRKKILSSKGFYFFKLFEGKKQFQMSANGYRRKSVRTSISLEVKIKAGLAEEIEIKLTPYTFFSFETGILMLPVVSTHDQGNFAVNLSLDEGSDPLTFSLIMKDVRPIAIKGEELESSFKDGILSIPSVTVDDGSGVEKQYKVTMKQIPDSWQFEVTERIPIQ